MSSSDEKEGPAKRDPKARWFAVVGGSDGEVLALLAAAVAKYPGDGGAPPRHADALQQLKQLGEAAAEYDRRAWPSGPPNLTPVRRHWLPRRIWRGGCGARLGSNPAGGMFHHNGGRCSRWVRSTRRSNIIGSLPVQNGARCTATRCAILRSSFRAAARRQRRGAAERAEAWAAIDGGSKPASRAPICHPGCCGSVMSLARRGIR